MTEGTVLEATSETSRGVSYPFVWKRRPPSGAIKKVYFAPDKSYVIAVYKKAGKDSLLRQRLENIVCKYKNELFETPIATANVFRKKLFCWPFDYVSCRLDGREHLGIVMPFYPDGFRFANGQGKEFGYFQDCIDRYHPLFLSRQDENAVALSEDWRVNFKMALQLSRAVRILHTAGLAHSDLSDGNVLLNPDPKSPSILVIDVDGLVVPYLKSATAQVNGSRSYQAPELAEAGSSASVSPCIDTDRHSLAVMVYRLLLRRDPFGGILSGPDDARDTRRYGDNALFCENPIDRSANYDVNWRVKTWAYRISECPDLKTKMLPWEDIKQLPYTVLGPYLAQCVEEAFIWGLHRKRPRPGAGRWEDSLAKTIDMLIRCENPACKTRWFVADGIQKCRCPFCGKMRTKPYAILKYVERDNRSKFEFEADVIKGVDGATSYFTRRIVLWPGKLLFPVHAHTSPPLPSYFEHLSDEQRTRVAEVLVDSKGNFWIRNKHQANLIVWFKSNDRKKLQVPNGKVVRLCSGLRIQLDGPTSRILEVEMVK